MENVEALNQKDTSYCKAVIKTVIGEYDLFNTLRI